jgi:two-component system response regulator DesR
LIKALLAERGGLIRGALAFVLSREPDIEVVAEVGRAIDVGPTVRASRPDVSVLDLDLLGVDQLSRAYQLQRDKPGCRVLILAELRRSGLLARELTRQVPGVGFLSREGSPDRVVEAVRRIARDEPVTDPQLVVAALCHRNPLTTREIDVLRTVAAGGPLREVAVDLGLSPGTVRNHLSRIIAKTGARTRIEALRMAENGGWI